MMFNIIKRDTILRKGLLPFLGILILAFGLSSCNDSFIFDDEGDCEPGINLRFVFDYHMEPGANAFAANVDCISVFVFDNEGNYIKHLSETSNVLQSDSYRMKLPLDPGKYNLLVYGGITCDDSAFEFTPGWQTKASFEDAKSNVRVTLPLNEEGISNKKLHDIEDRTGGLFYGTLDIEITEEDGTVEEREETVYLMKDTNNIQVILQELASPYTCDYNDYHFYIIDDNFILDGHNREISIADENNLPHYEPYAYANRQMGYVEPIGNDGTPVSEDSSKPVQVACAEFSTSRLFVEHLATAQLLITSSVEKDDKGNDKEIIKIPLITYLAATRGFGQNWIKSDQEYLDRQSNWTLMFFLQRNHWVRTRIAVNNWIVRVNEIELD